MTVVFATLFPLISIGASVATVFALVKFVREIRKDYKT